MVFKAVMRYLVSEQSEREEIYRLNPEALPCLETWKMKNQHGRLRNIHEVQRSQEGDDLKLGEVF